MVLDIKDNMFKEKNKEKDNSFGLMGQDMKENSKIIICTDLRFNFLNFFIFY